MFGEVLRRCSERHARGFEITRSTSIIRFDTVFRSLGEIYDHCSAHAENPASARRTHAATLPSPNGRYTNRGGKASVASRSATPIATSATACSGAVTGRHGNRINTGRTSTVAPNLLWSLPDRLIGTFRTIGWALSQAQSDDGSVSVSRECLERYFRGKSI